jgi:tetratricopeptide (TPR) repeat protein
MILSCMLVVGLLAQSPVEDDIAFQEGLRLVEAFEYEKAVFKFREVQKGDRPAAERAIAAAWLGLTYAKLGENDAALEALEQAVELDPLVVLPKSAPPKVREQLDEARRRVQERRQAAPPPPPPPPPDDTPPPPAEVEVEVPPPPPAQPPPAPGISMLVPVGAGVAVLGLLGITVGVIAGLSAQSTHAEALATATQIERAGRAADAEQAALLANVGYGAGAGLTVAGAVIAAIGLLDGGDAQ